MTSEGIAFTQQIQKEQAERVDDIDSKLTRTQGKPFYIFKSKTSSNGGACVGWNESITIVYYV